MNDEINSDSFPKILIIGEAIHKKTGSGITLYNFFADWPKDRIAILAGTSIFESDATQCNNYYVWKTKTSFITRVLKRVFIKHKNATPEGPLSTNDILKRQETKEIIGKTDIPETDVSSISKVGYYYFKYLRSTLQHIYRVFNEFIGLSPLNNKIEITESLQKWYSEYSPDVIYTFLNRYEQFQLVQYLHKKYKTPFVVHPMDEHIKFMPPKGLLYLYWKYAMNEKFNLLITNASVRLSICNYMSKTYKSRYNQEFFAFHNPVETAKWLPYSKINWRNNDSFRILYMGRYGFDNHGPIHAFSQVIDELVTDGYKIQLDLRFTILSDHDGIKTFNVYKNTKIVVFNSHKEYSEAYSEIPLILPRYDLLYIPYGFDKRSIEYFRLSMPTKTAEYMISGTPILVNAPRETAIYQYASDGKWGYLLDTESKTELKKALLEIMQNESLREQIGSQAKKLAIQNHDASVIRNNLRLEFVKAINKGQDE